MLRPMEFSNFFIMELFESEWNHKTMVQFFQRPNINSLARKKEKSSENTGKSLLHEQASFELKMAALSFRISLGKYPIFGIFSNKCDIPNNFKCEIRLICEISSKFELSLHKNKYCRQHPK